MCNFLPYDYTIIGGSLFRTFVVSDCVYDRSTLELNVLRFVKLLVSNFA
jgi:hypothetical protein